MKKAKDMQKQKKAQQSKIIHKTWRGIEKTNQIESYDATAEWEEKQEKETISVLKRTEKYSHLTEKTFEFLKERVAFTEVDLSIKESKLKTTVKEMMRKISIFLSKYESEEVDDSVLESFVVEMIAKILSRYCVQELSSHIHFGFINQKNIALHRVLNFFASASATPASKIVVYKKLSQYSTIEIFLKEVFDLIEKQFKKLKTEEEIIAINQEYELERENINDLKNLIAQTIKSVIKKIAGDTAKNDIVIAQELNIKIFSVLMPFLIFEERNEFYLKQLKEALEAYIIKEILEPYSDGKGSTMIKIAKSFDIKHFKRIYQKIVKDEKREERNFNIIQNALNQAIMNQDQVILTFNEINQPAQFKDIVGKFYKCDLSSVAPEIGKDNKICLKLSREQYNDINQALAASIDSLKQTTKKNVDNNDKMHDFKQKPFTELEDLAVKGEEDEESVLPRFNELKKHASEGVVLNARIEKYKLSKQERSDSDTEDESEEQLRFKSK